MRAAVLFETGTPLKVVDGIIVPPLKFGQVNIDIAFSGVCHSQLMEVRGKRGEDKYLPHLLGHEATGIVREIGEGVTKVAVGDRVILGWIRGKGQNAAGAIYTWNNQVINSGGITTFNETTIASENRLVKLPVGLPMDIGVLFGCAIPTGAGMIYNELDIKEGSSVIVIGVGGIGAISLMYAKSQKPKTLIAIDISAEKRNSALEMGADFALDGNAPDILEQIKALTDGHGADFCIDAAGKAKTIELAFSTVCRNGGQCVFASHPEAGEMISIDPFELINGKQIKGSWGGGAVPDRDIPLFFKISQDNNLPLQGMVTKRYPLEEVNQALCDLEQGKVARPLLEINPALEHEV